MTKKQLTKVLPFKWRIQNENKDFKTKKVTAVCVAYIDGREATQTLDDNFGYDGWTEEYYQVNNSTYCKIGVWSEKTNQFIYKSDAGQTTRDMLLNWHNELLSNPQKHLDFFKLIATEKESAIDLYQKTIRNIRKELDNVSKSEATDAFKRACVKLGIGRFLYSMEKVILNINGWDIVDDSNKVLFQKTESDKLSTFCNMICSLPFELVEEIKSSSKIDDLQNIYYRMFNLQRNLEFKKLINEQKEKFK